MFGIEAEFFAIAHHFGIRQFAENGDADFGASAAGAIDAVSDFRAGAGGVANALEDGCAESDFAGLALPEDGPAAALIADVVGGIASDVNVRGVLW